MFAPYSPSRRMMPLTRHVLLVLLVLYLALDPAIAQQLSAPGAFSPEAPPAAAKSPSVEDMAACGEAPFSRLYEYIKPDAMKVRRLAPLKAEELPINDSMAKRLQIGVVRSITADTLSSSSFYSVAGGSVGVMALRTEGALMTRAHFSGVALPPGATIFVYSMRNPNEFYGPYEGVGPLGDGTFWTPPVEGDGIVIEYFIPDSRAGATAAAAYFQVSEVSHIFIDPATLYEAETAKPEAPEEATAGACNLNVTSEWSNTAKSVGRLQFTSGGFEGLCTGTLLNTTNSSFIPYLLTANHCFDSEAEAQSLRVYWNYNSAGPLPVPPNRTDGATLLATGTTSDFTFVRLTGAVPGGLLYSGWDANAPPPLGTSITGIHHPQGDYKRISFGTTQSSSCGGVVPGLQCIGARWSSGTTEQGSSGSGIWKGSSSDPRLIGTLTGGAASCSNLSGIDQYGRFDVTYQNISQYLNSGSPTSTIALSASSYNVNENVSTGVVLITVNRTGDTTATSSVDYATSDQSGSTPCQTNTGSSASDRCDYATARGTLRFAAGEASKQIQIPIIDDIHVEPLQSFTLTLTNAQSATLGATTSATVNITDNDTSAPTTNPINGVDFFIKAQYVDFLGRVAEPAGLSFWTGRLGNCPAGDTTCDRIDTAKRFFESDEFKQRGYYVFKLYDVVLGRLPLYTEFVPDVARLNGFQTVAEQQQNKAAYLSDFMAKTEFRNLYSAYVNTNGTLVAGQATGFVDALIAKSGITIPVATRTSLINNLSNGTRTPAQTIEDFIEVAEISAVGTRFYDRAIITMQYFGFLRRNPDQGGFDFWWNRLANPASPFYHNYREIVGNFITADEYYFRYSSVLFKP